MLARVVCKATGFLAKFVQNQKIMATCPLHADVQSQTWYQEQIARLDPMILALGLSQPALRALVNLSIYSLNDLKVVDEQTLRNGHGIGPNAMKKLETLR
ncbi:helix-hairpin-helix domain-containing protein [Aquirufa sp. TARAVU-A1A]|jgi:hypothetical protein